MKSRPPNNNVKNPTESTHHNVKHCKSLNISLLWRKYAVTIIIHFKVYHLSKVVV